MQVASLQSIVSTNTFKDFHIPNSALCSTLAPHEHVGVSAVKVQTAAADSMASEKTDSIKKILPLAGAVIGTFLPLVLLNKSKGKSLNAEVLKKSGLLEKLKEIGEYFEIDGVKEILSTAGGAMLGGLAGGFLADKNRENRKEKVKNAVFEMINITVPTFFVVGTEKLLSSAKMNPALKKIIPIALGVGIGAPAASKISSAINKKAFQEDEAKQRHFRPKDYLVHIDDIVTAFALAKLPFLKAIPFDKILAFIYIHCGYEAGSKDVNDKKHKGHDRHH